MLSRAPVVTQVLVSSSNWSTEFKEGNLGGTGGFYAVPTDDGQLRNLPWEIDQIRIVFDRDVTISQDDLQIMGSADPSTPLSLGSFSTDGHVATWTLSDPVFADKLMLLLNDQSITGGCGEALDGEFVTGSGAAHSGDGTPGGVFGFRINVLAGDADGNGQVDSGDVVPIGAAFLTTPGEVAWDAFADLDGSGQVDSGDTVPLGAHFGNTLPTEEPPVPTFAEPPLASPFEVPSDWQSPDSDGWQQEFATNWSVPPWSSDSLIGFEAERSPWEFAVVDK